jgi:hypothetical protein
LLCGFDRTFDAGGFPISLFLKSLSLIKPANISSFCSIPSTINSRLIYQSKKRYEIIDDKKRLLKKRCPDVEDPDTVGKIGAGGLGVSPGFPFPPGLGD